MAASLSPAYLAPPPAATNDAMEISSDAGRGDQDEDNDIDLDLDDLDEDNQVGDDSYMADDNDPFDSEKIPENATADDPMLDETAIDWAAEVDEELDDASQHELEQGAETLGTEEIELHDSSTFDEHKDQEYVLEDQDQDTLYEEPAPESENTQQPENEETSQGVEQPSVVGKDILPKEHIADEAELLATSTKQLENALVASAEDQQASNENFPLGASQQTLHDTEDQNETLTREQKFSRPTIPAHDPEELSAHPHIPSHETKTTTADTSAKTTESRRSSAQSQEHDYKQEFAQHPVIVWVGEDDSYRLFSDDEDSSLPHMLVDYSLATSPFQDLFAEFRNWYGEHISDNDEIELDAPSLSLKIGEDSPYASSATLTDVLELYVNLCRNEAQSTIEPLHVNLTTRLRFFQRFQVLRDAVTEGKGLFEMNAESYDDDDYGEEDLNTSGIENYDNSHDDAPAFDDYGGGGNAVASSANREVHEDAQDNDVDHAGEDELDANASSHEIEEYLEEHDQDVASTLDQPETGAEGDLFDGEENGTTEDLWEAYPDLQHQAETFSEHEDLEDGKVASAVDRSSNVADLDQNHSTEPTNFSKGHEETEDFVNLPSEDDNKDHISESALIASKSNQDLKDEATAAAQSSQPASPESIHDATGVDAEAEPLDEPHADQSKYEDDNLEDFLDLDEGDALDGSGDSKCKDDENALTEAKGINPSKNNAADSGTAQIMKANGNASRATGTEQLSRKRSWQQRRDGDDEAQDGIDEPKKRRQS